MKPKLTFTKQSMDKSHATSKKIAAAFACFVTVAFAQVGADKSKLGGNIRITKAEASVMGRGVGADSMFVGYEIDYCLAGSNSKQDKSGRALRIRFASKNLTDSIISAETLVRGELAVAQEPLDGKSERCSKVRFSVSADALIGLKILDNSSSPRLLLESSSGAELFASRQILLTLRKSAN